MNTGHLLVTEYFYTVESLILLENVSFTHLDRVWHCTWWPPLPSPHMAFLRAELEAYCRSESWFCCPDHRYESTPPRETTLTSYHPLWEQKDICTQSPLQVWIIYIWFFKAHSPGQGFPWQPRVSASDPAQWRPPLAGRGLLHCLSLFWDPTPQDTLQGPHSAHSE